MENAEKVFFKPGDLVTLRLDLPNKPIMLVVRKETNLIPDLFKDTQLRGIHCRWFTTDGEMLSATWSTKDLELI